MNKWFNKIKPSRTTTTGELLSWRATDDQEQASAVSDQRQSAPILDEK